LKRHIDRAAVVVSDERKFRGDSVAGDVLGEIRRLSVDKALAHPEACFLESNQISAAALEDIDNLEIDDLVGWQRDMERDTAGIEGFPCSSVEDCGRLLADAIDTHSRDPSDDRTQKEALVGLCPLGKGLVHFSGGRQHQKREAVGGRVAVEIGQVVGAVIGHLRIERNLRHFRHEDAVFRYEATLLGHEVGDRSTYPIALRELPQRFMAAGKKQGFTGRDRRCYFRDG
jgi:hypothetical protein